jgi:hypothetical protein
MKIKKFEMEFEGTDVEYETYVRLTAITPQQSNHNSTLTGKPSSHPVNGSETGARAPSEVVPPNPNQKFVTLDEAKRILTRRPLSAPMRDMIQQLFQAGERRTASKQIREAIGFGDADPSGGDKFRGLLGAFGRRVTHDVEKGTAFFDQQWNVAANEYDWLLPASVRQAIEELGWFGQENSNNAN